MTRRTLLGRAAGVGGAVALRGPAAALAREPISADGTFSLGVASGFPGTRDAVLWSRVDGLERSSRVYVEVARDPGFRHVVRRTLVRAPAIRDFTVRYHATGLEPGEEYHYRFHTRHHSSPVGRIRTLRPLDSRQPVRIGLFSCQSYEAGYYTAHAGLAAEDDLDLVVCLGDYVYEHHFYDGPAERTDRTGRNGDGDVQSHAEYRQKYRLYRSDPNLQAMHAAWPIVPIWDDHEVEDNYAGSGPDSISKDPAHTENDNKYPRRLPFAERRRAGYLAHFEYMPRIRSKPVDTKIYGTVPLGANATLFLTDERQYRSPQPCGDQLAAPCADDGAASQTMLGAAQKAWFLDALAADRATWKLWANEVMLMAFDSAPGVPVNPDQWDGYAAERTEILETCVTKGVKNLVALTGDIHTFFAGNVTTTGRTGGTPAATEFVGGSMTSGGLETVFGPATPATGSILVTNPHMTYLDTAHRGYMVVTAGPDALDVVYRSPASILTPKSAVADLARFRVDAGTPAVHRVS